MQLPVTGLYAGILALSYIALAFLVIRGRWKFRVGLGTGDHKTMKKYVRIHGNFSEYIPFALFMMLLLEVQEKVPVTHLHAIGLSLILGRVAHCVGLLKSSGSSPYRVFGMATVFTVLIFASIRLIF